MNVFKLEKYLSHLEFRAPYLLCCSDAESYAMSEILEMASPEERLLWNNLQLSYTEPTGLPQLRQTIAEEIYPGLQSDQVHCFAGAEEGIFCSLYTLCEPTDHVIVLTPCYQSLIEIPKLKGCEITTIPLVEENDWKIDIKSIKKAIKPNTKCVIINFPHNPTGQVITQDELTDLVNVLDQHGIWLFSDEAYHLLGNPTMPWAKPAATIYPKAISVGVMSKAYGMAGVRIGWIACQDKSLLQKIEHVKHYTSICNSAPSEILSLIAIKNKEKLIQRNNQIVSENSRLLDEFFSEYADIFSWVRPQGGCVGFVNYKKNEPVDAFCEKLLEEKGVLLIPASIYDLSSNHFRIGFGRKNMPEALNQLREFVGPLRQV